MLNDKHIDFTNNAELLVCMGMYRWNWGRSSHFYTQIQKLVNIFADDNLGNPLLDSLKNSRAKSSNASVFNNAELA